MLNKIFWIKLIIKINTNSLKIHLYLTVLRQSIFVKIWTTKKNQRNRLEILISLINIPFLREFCNKENLPNRARGEES